MWECRSFPTFSIDRSQREEKPTADEYRDTIRFDVYGEELLKRSDCDDGRELRLHSQ